MKYAAAAIVAVMASGAAHAEELKVKPGMWETSTVVNMVMEMNGQKMPLPAQTQSSSECVSEEDAVFSPDDLTGDGCTAANIQTTATSLSFDMSCAQGPSAMTGHMSFELTDGNTKGTGLMTMSGEIPGQGAINATGEITAARIGDC